MIHLFTKILSGFILFLSFLSHAQPLEQTDSIYRRLLISPADTNLIDDFNSSISDLSYINPDTALFYARQMDSLSSLAGYPHGTAMALNLQGVSYELSGRLRKAIELYLQAEKHSREHGLLLSLSNIYNNMGIAYSFLGAYETSLDYHYKSLELAETLGDSIKISVNYNNIGLRLSHLSQEERAIVNYKNALNINLKLERFRPLSTNYLNLGRAYVITHFYDSAIYYYHKSMHIFEQHFPNSTDKSLVSNGLAYTYLHLENMDSARFYLELSKEISEKTQDFYGKLDALLLEGEIHKFNSNYSQASRVLLKALDLAKEAGLFANELDIYRELAEIKHLLGLNKEAYGYFLLHSEMKDSIFNVKKINEIANMEFTYQVDKQARIDSLKQVQADLLRLDQEKEAKYLASRKNTLEFSGIALFVLMIFLLILMRRRFNMSDKVINLLIFVFFLIIFEASLVAFDPLIDKWSQGEVALKVLFNSVLAFAIFTTHHFLEDRMNKMIRNQS